MICRACGHDTNSKENCMDFIELKLVGEVRIHNSDESIDINILENRKYSYNYYCFYICPECGTVRAE